MLRNTAIVLAGLFLALAGPLGQAAAAQSTADVIAAAIADPHRPDSDRKRCRPQVPAGAGVRRREAWRPRFGFHPRGRPRHAPVLQIVGAKGRVYAAVLEKLLNMPRTDDRRTPLLPIPPIPMSPCCANR